MFRNTIFSILILGLMVSCADQSGTGSESAKTQEKTASKIEDATPLAAGSSQDVVRQAIARVFPQHKIDSVAKSPIPDIYEVVLGTEVFYVTEDGKYVFNGDLIELASRRSLTEGRRAGIRKEMLAEESESNMIVFAAKDQKYRITVFTDIDCGYCRKLHSQIAKYNVSGITVRYLAFPRAGVGSRSYQKAVDVWCANDRKKAMTDAKAGLPVNSKQCENPVKDQYELGNKLGVRGTPAIILDSGEMLPGYMPPERLLQVLAQN